MALNPALIGRLENYKFKSAENYIDDKVTEGEKAIIEALSRLFGNVGWGLEGDIGTLLEWALSGLVFADQIPSDDPGDIETKSITERQKDIK